MPVKKNLKKGFQKKPTVEDSIALTPSDIDRVPFYENPNYCKQNHKNKVRLTQEKIIWKWKCGLSLTDADIKLLESARIGRLFLTRGQKQVVGFTIRAEALDKQRKTIIMQYQRSIVHATAIPLSVLDSEMDMDIEKSVDECEPLTSVVDYSVQPRTISGVITIDMIPDSFVYTIFKGFVGKKASDVWRSTNRHTLTYGDALSFLRSGSTLTQNTYESIVHEQMAVSGWKSSVIFWTELVQLIQFGLDIQQITKLPHFSALQSRLSEENRENILVLLSPYQTQQHIVLSASKILKCIKIFIPQQPRQPVHAWVGDSKDRNHIAIIIQFTKVLFEAIFQTQGEDNEWCKFGKWPWNEYFLTNDKVQVTANVDISPIVCCMWIDIVINELVFNGRGIVDENFLFENDIALWYFTLLSTGHNERDMDIKQSSLHSIDFSTTISDEGCSSANGHLTDIEFKKTVACMKTSKQNMKSLLMEQQTGSNPHSTCDNNNRVTGRMMHLSSRLCSKSNNHTKFSKVDDVHLIGLDFQSLLPGAYLNDSIVLAYLGLIENRSKKDGMPRVSVFESNFVQKMKSIGYASVKHWVKENIWEKNLLIFPIHNKYHRSLIVINLDMKTIIHYNSLDSSDPINMMLAMDFLIHEYRHRTTIASLNVDEWQFMDANNIPRQTNVFDCGVFMCKYAEYLSRGAALDFHHTDMTYYRMLMMTELYSSKLFY